MGCVCVETTVGTPVQAYGLVSSIVRLAAVLQASVEEGGMSPSVCPVRLCEQGYIIYTHTLHSRNGQHMC